MKILFKEPGKQPRTMVVPNELGVLQQLVDGYIEHIKIKDGIGLIVNEEGKLNGMESNFYLWKIRDMIHGPAIFLGEDGEDFTDISCDDMETVKLLFDYATDLEVAHG